MLSDLRCQCGPDEGIIQRLKHELPMTTAPRFQLFCSTRRNMISLLEFRQELLSDFQRDRHLQLMILAKGEPAGTIYSYGFNPTDRYVFITIYVAREFENTGCGVEAFVLFALYLFKTFQLFKIYLDVYSYNAASLRLLSDERFILEGKFRGHRRIGEKRYDLFRFALLGTALPDFDNFTQRLKGIHLNLKGGDLACQIPITQATAGSLQ